LGNNFENGPRYPIGTLVYYGPDDKTVTKITASVIPFEDAPPIYRKWIGDEVTLDPIVIAELGQFFKGHGVEKVVMASTVEGCPHERGVDYPVDEDCPYCPFWKNQKK
jgi:hypothetical protein